MAEKELTAEEEFDAAFDEDDVEQQDSDVDDDVETDGQGDDGEDLDHSAADPAGDDGELPDKEKEHDDIWATATKEQRDYLESIRREKESVEKDRDSWLHKYRSDEGRFRAAQRQMQERAKKPQPTQEEVTEALQDSEKFKEFSEVWGDQAEMLLHVHELTKKQLRDEIKRELQPTFEEIERRNQQYEHDQREAAKLKVAQSLDAARPGWRETVQGADFAEWAKRQPPYKQQVIFESYDAAEVASILDDFELHTQVASLRSKQVEADKAKHNRDKRLERSMTPQNKAGVLGKPSDMPQDFDAVFKSIT